ncbi:single-stranded DNA-binding protein [Francisella philomiragia]|uniref:single-stranded DNA-binding protein n=1 Tax=Francisella philomiragia TaxID=28110 RepID=UPI00190366C6|nr:single-stranded DNA-binding protein [Francisella philomiragia]MBK2341718.1 single-stranded DNA-binding protein [Francisella philomiragia]
MIDLFTGHRTRTEIQARVGWIGELMNKDGKYFISFNLVSHIFKNVEWYSCIAYDENAKQIDRFAQLGTEMYIEGYNRTDNWTDKDGIKRNKTNVIVRNLGFIANTKSELNYNDYEHKAFNHEMSEEDNQAAIEIAKKVLTVEGYVITKPTEESDK